jgi:hypothetical protein
LLESGPFKYNHARTRANYALSLYRYDNYEIKQIKITRRQNEEEVEIGTAVGRAVCGSAGGCAERR